MDAGLLLTAILIGFGFGNIFLCTFVAMSATVGRGWEVGAAFIGGRFVGIMALGVFIVLFGWYVDLDSSTMLLLFALMSLAFGALVLLWPAAAVRIGLLRHCEVGGCENCEHEDAASDSPHDCTSCPSSGACSHNEDRDSNIKSGLGKNQGLSTASVAMLGAVRGATPCLKILLLVPLILTLPLYESLAVTALYALSSSIYAIIGILAGSLLGIAISEKWPLQLTRAGALMMIGIGIYYAYRFWTYSCPGGF